MENTAMKQRLFKNYISGLSRICFKMQGKHNHLTRTVILLAALLSTSGTYATETDSRHPLLPGSCVIQYAGSIGFASAGVEWQYGKRKQWRTTLLAGYIPKRHSSRAKAAMTIKQTYSPWQTRVTESTVIRPLNCGIFFNTIYSHKFWTKEPDKYPEGYYQISTRVRPHIFAGQEITFKPKRRMAIKSVTLYYELNSCDIYLCSYFTNMKYLRAKDVIALGIGTKIGF